MTYREFFNNIKFRVDLKSSIDARADVSSRCKKNERARPKLYSSFPVIGGARNNRADISVRRTKYVAMYAVTLQEYNHCFYLTHITSAQLELRKHVGKKKKP